VTGKVVFRAGLLVPMPFAPSFAASMAGVPANRLTATLVVGLPAFGFVFAVNSSVISSVHSCLNLAFCDASHLSWHVGFYHMSAVAGRLIGMLLSGLSFQFGGLPLCIATAGMMAALNWWTIARLRPAG